LGLSNLIHQLREIEAGVIERSKVESCGECRQ